MRILIGPFLGLMALITPVHGQQASAEDEGPICVGGGPGWRPSFNESRAIAAVPVPDSYRRMFESTEPCVEWRMGIERLVDWHLKFGSVESVTDALRYIEVSDLRSLPAPSAYMPQLRSAVVAAIPDLKRASELKQPPGLNYSVSYSFMQGSKKVTQLNELLRARENYVFFAQHYLRAAEEFVEPALLEKGEVYISAAVAAAEYLAPLESLPPVKGQLHFNLDQFETDDLKARAALLRAQISGSVTDLKQADAILKALEKAGDQRLAELAYSGGDSFCDITDGASQSEEIAAACRADDNIERRLPNLVVNRAQYEAIAAGFSAGQLEIGWPSWAARVDRLLAFDMHLYHALCCGASVDQYRWRLLNTRARFAVHFAIEPLGEGMTFGKNYDRPQAWLDALELLSQAEKLAPPYSAPARFTRIARQWLAVWNFGPVVFSGDELRIDPMQDAERRRFAEYLAASVASLGEKPEASR